MTSDVVKAICNEMGSTVPTEARDFTLLSCRQKGKIHHSCFEVLNFQRGDFYLTVLLDGLVRPLHPQEYLLDFLNDDDSSHLYLRRFLWRNALFFVNDLYTEVHYQQVTGMVVSSQYYQLCH